MHLAAGGAQRGTVEGDGLVGPAGAQVDAAAAVGGHIIHDSNGTVVVAQRNAPVVGGGHYAGKVGNRAAKGGGRVEGRDCANKQIVACAVQLAQPGIAAGLAGQRGDVLQFNAPAVGTNRPGCLQQHAAGGTDFRRRAVGGAGADVAPCHQLNRAAAGRPAIGGAHACPVDGDVAGRAAGPDVHRAVGAGADVVDDGDRVPRQAAEGGDADVAIGCRHAESGRDAVLGGDAANDQRLVVAEAEVRRRAGDAGCQRADQVLAGAPCVVEAGRILGVDEQARGGEIHVAGFADRTLQGFKGHRCIATGDDILGQSQITRARCTILRSRQADVAIGRLHAIYRCTRHIGNGANREDVLVGKHKGARAGHAAGDHRHIVAGVV